MSHWWILCTHQVWISPSPLTEATALLQLPSLPAPVLRHNSFSTKAEPKRTNLKTVRDLMVRELRRKEYMITRKWKSRKKLHGNLCKCCSSISKHEKSSEEHQAIVSYILMVPNNTHSHLTLWTVYAFLEPDNPFLFTWDSYIHREHCKGKTLGQDGYGCDWLRSA